jgi:uncharacterized protein (UPF0548 family)
MSSDLESRLSRAELTYSEVGQTAGSLPAGYHYLRRSAVVGAGSGAFAAAAASLLSWGVHSRAGLRVVASAPTAEPGAVVLLSIGAGPIRIGAPCRVVYTVTEPRRRGFAYGTLPGHPESGEEAFVVEHKPDDAVTFTITAFSRPATATARIAGPLGRLIQRQATSRYLHALARRQSGLNVASARDLYGKPARPGAGSAGSMGHRLGKPSGRRPINGIPSREARAGSSPAACRGGA